MPNLVVYVPAGMWRRLHDLGLDDPKIEARKVALGALDRWLSQKQPVAVGPVGPQQDGSPEVPSMPSGADPLKGLSERGAVSSDRAPLAAEVAGSSPAPSPRSESPYERTFKPDPKPEKKKR